MKAAVPLLLAAGLAVAMCARADGDPRSASGTSAKATTLTAAATPTCIRWWAEARYRPYGYDHVVHIQNGCSATAECLVATDVNPSPTPATVAPGAEVEVVTWVGSPAREFNASVWCELRSP